MKNIVLLGGSNSVVTKGLKIGLARHSNLTNLALGATTTLQNLYELLRAKNQEAIKNADLIVTESNINDISFNIEKREKLDLRLVLRDICWYYEALYRLNKKICVIILPYFEGEDYEQINNMHRIMANYYGFALIDAQKYYIENDLRRFGEHFWAHQPNVINKKLGANISQNTDKFPLPKEGKKGCELPKFAIFNAHDMPRIGDFKEAMPKNSLFCEKILRLEPNNALLLKAAKGWRVIGLHSWNLGQNGDIAMDFCATSGIIIGDEKTQVRRAVPKMNTFSSIKAELIINDDFMLRFNPSPINSEYHPLAYYDFKQSCFLPHFDIVALFLCSPYDESAFVAPESISNEIIAASLDFTHLMPEVEFFADCKEFIDEYVPKYFDNFYKELKTKVIAPLKEKITELERLNSRI